MDRMYVGMMFVKSACTDSNNLRLLLVFAHFVRRITDERALIHAPSQTHTHIYTSNENNKIPTDYRVDGVWNGNSSETITA